MDETDENDFVAIYLESMCDMHLDEVVDDVIDIVALADDDVEDVAVQNDAVQLHIEADEVVDDVQIVIAVVRDDELVASEYLYWGIQANVTIIYLDDVSMNVIDTVSIALQVIEL